ncbi:MAG: hypothetical protein ACTSYO_09440 [Candidatus Ranarchaeia archaeon]
MQTTENVRRKNRLASPKKGGNCLEDSLPYINELGINIDEKRQPIQFTTNYEECVHRWAPYVQGFSASFVQSVFNEYRDTYSSPRVLDPFAGCGTVLVQSKFNGYSSFGVELNPLLHFIADSKTNSWSVSPKALLRRYKRLSYNKMADPPLFLKTQRHFRKGVLRNLRRIKYAINALRPRDEDQRIIKNLLWVAFSSILIDVSNLKRSPCLGYAKNKLVSDDAPYALMNQKVFQIAEDLELLQKEYADYLDVPSKVVCENSRFYDYPDKFDLAITSPPYMNGMDYVINYKIEMAWLDFIRSQRDAKKIKDAMVVCDNVSRNLIKQFSHTFKYTNEWIEEIKESISLNISIRGKYRREDMPFIVHKYFQDMYEVIGKVAASLNHGGRFILVVGDSLIADTYVPTDLILARIGRELGLEIEKIELARNRRSGQIRDYTLRETIITLRK